MSHSLPTAPAPPPPSNNVHKLASVMPTKTQIDECLWALPQPELQKACFLARICAIEPPKKCQYLSIASILQEGPTCGLTALSMLLADASAISPLLADARDLRYTNNGEMFSALNLFQLLNVYLQRIPIAASATKECSDDNSRNVAQSHLHKGPLNCAKVKDSLLAGACIFVPYDPDFNHAPCLKLGHKAHWALVIGYLITQEDEFYVLARHGKAKNLAVWSLSALSESNANLFEFAQPKGYPDCDFLLPAGGIGGDLGLRERAIIVEGLPRAVIAIR